VDERNLNVAIPIGAALDERQGGQESFGVGEVLSRGAAWLWVLFMGWGPFPVKVPVVCWRTRPGRLLVC
jgi:hypothetical protein